MAIFVFELHSARNSGGGKYNTTHHHPPITPWLNMTSYMRYDFKYWRYLCLCQKHWQELISLQNLDASVNNRRPVRKRLYYLVTWPESTLVQDDIYLVANIRDQPTRYLSSKWHRSHLYLINFDSNLYSFFSNFLKCFMIIKNTYL